jgi:hypothetical protein
MAGDCFPATSVQRCFQNRNKAKPDTPGGTEIMHKYTILPVAAALLLCSCADDSGQKMPEDGTIPAIVNNTLKIRKAKKTYVITGIGSSGTNKVAIINNEILTPGKEIDPGVVLLDIQPTYAVIGHGNSKYLLRPEDIQAELDKKK